MEAKKIQKIAIFRALQLGDMLCIIPAIRALKASLPEASLTLIGLPWQRDFANRFHYYFDHFIEFPGWPGLPEQQVDPVKAVAFLKYMQDQRYDLVLQMQGHGAITNTMCMLWGAGKIAGLRKPGEYCPDEKLFPVSGDDEHEVLRFLKLTDALAVPQQGTFLEFPFLEEETEHFNIISKTLELPVGKYVCIHPGARDPKRRWPAGNFALTGDHLAARGYTVVLTGSEDERPLLEETAALMQRPAINTIAQLNHVSLGDLAGIIGHSRLLISNDTGVSHIAAALRIPSVVIFSPFSDRRRWAPLDNTLHRVIPFEEAADADVVIRCALEQLAGHHPAGNVTALSPQEMIL
jgi:ADP-heptose:LPS heptosyltransferase